MRRMSLVIMAMFVIVCVRGLTACSGGGQEESESAATEEASIDDLSKDEGKVRHSIILSQGDR